MFTEVIRAFAFIFLAEMGDKTQILAMTFATKYDVKKVLLGIMIGAFLNHGIAVLLGSAFSTIIPATTMQIVAGFAFVLFALWSLKFSEESEDDNVKKVKYGPIITVALAFFIGELGDKTQLTAITLAASSSYPIFILMGTVLGMVVTGALGIYVGIKLGNKIPEFYIKCGAAIIFFVVGFTKLYQSLPSHIGNPLYGSLFVIVFMAISYFLLRPTLLLRKNNHMTYLQKVSEELASYYRVISDNLEDICLGETVCGKCDGTSCLVGYTKSVIQKARNNKPVDLSYFDNIDQHKNFDKIKVMESLKITIYQLKDDPKNPALKSIHLVRKNLEMILLNKSISHFQNYEQYKKELYGIDKSIFKKMNLK
ncbi:MAG: TMEM165/GDT1 family protein [Bacilli bacterium]|nr:TMEM165/GDT1 family protein [Bacilli bacterium]